MPFKDYASRYIGRPLARLVAIWGSRTREEAEALQRDNIAPAGQFTAIERRMGLDRLKGDRLCKTGLTLSSKVRHPGTFRVIEDLVLMPGAVLDVHNLIVEGGLKMHGASLRATGSVTVGTRLHATSSTLEIGDRFGQAGGSLSVGSNDRPPVKDLHSTLLEDRLHLSDSGVHCNHVEVAAGNVTVIKGGVLDTNGLIADGEVQCRDASSRINSDYISATRLISADHGAMIHAPNMYSPEGWSYVSGSIVGTQHHRLKQFVAAVAFPRGKILRSPDAQP